MRSLTRSNLLAVIALLATLLVGIHTAEAGCGDGVLEQNEECDPGGELYVQGDPSNPACTSNGDCFYESTCCKFNCQFANPGPCFDGNACTVTDECDNVGVCQGGVLAEEGEPCDDGLFCTVTDTCNDTGTCTGTGSPCTLTECVTLCDDDTDECFVDEGASCTDDGNECTDDVCDAGGACTHPNNAAPCDDGAFCNGLDTCSDGACTDHSGDPCVAGGQCANTCDEVLDSCELPDATPCDDGLFCTDIDECSSGICVGTGDPCAGGAECNDLCDDDNDNCAVPFDVACTDDGNVCTDDLCDGAGSCIHPANSDPCDDGLLCTLVDTCVDGICVGAVPPQCEDENPCTFDACEDVGGTCLNLPAPNPSCEGQDVELLAQLVIGNRDDKAGRDKLKWKWGRVLTESMPINEYYGNPVDSTAFDLCVYDTTIDAPRIAAHLTIPSGPGWRQKGAKKILFKDKTGDPDGVAIVKLRGGNRPAMGIKAKRENLALTAFSEEVFFDQDPLVTVQLLSTEGRCWTTDFDTAKKNTPKKFRTKLRGIVVK